MREFERIAGTGEVLVVTLLIGHQPIVGRIVDAAVTERRAHMVAFAGVVVDDVEDHLDAGVMQRRDRRAEFVDGISRRVAHVRREKAQ